MEGYELWVKRKSLVRNSFGGVEIGILIFFVIEVVRKGFWSFELTIAN
jgi:hypothetical protein